LIDTKKAKNKKFKNDLFDAFEGSCKMAGKKRTPFVLQELHSFYLSPVGFTTICSDVYDVISAYGFNIKPEGIGWRVYAGN
jgi:hypothetical protein